MLKSPVLCTNLRPDVDSDRIHAASSSISVVQVAEVNSGDEESFMTLESHRGAPDNYIDHFTAYPKKEAPIRVSKTNPSKTGKEKSSSHATTTNKKKRKTWKKPPDKPKRPPSAYNLFFQLERERLLKIVQSKVKTESNCNDIISVDGAASEHEFTEEEVAHVAGIQTEMDRPKRKHRKTHGLIGFAELARAIATKWRVMDPTKKIVFNQCAIVEKQKYITRIEEWMDSRKKKKKQEQEEDVCSVTTDKSYEIRRKEKKMYKKKAFVSPVSIMEEIMHDSHLPYGEQHEYDRRCWNMYQGTNWTTYSDHVSIIDDDYHSPGFGETCYLEQNEMVSGHKAFGNTEKPEYVRSHAIQDVKKRFLSRSDNAYPDQIRLDSRNRIKGQPNFMSRYHYNDAHEHNLYGVSLMGTRLEDGGYYPHREHEKLYDIHDTMYKYRSPYRYHGDDIPDTEQAGTSTWNNGNVDRRACQAKKRTHFHQTDNLRRMAANHDRYYAAECRSINTNRSSLSPSCQPQNTENTRYHRPVSTEPFQSSNDEQFLENTMVTRNQAIVSYSYQENDTFGSSSVDAKRLRREDVLQLENEHKQFSNKANDKNFDSYCWKYKNEYDNSFKHGWNDQNNDEIGKTVDDYHSCTNGSTTDSTHNLCDAQTIKSDTRSF